MFKGFAPEVAHKLEEFIKRHNDLGSARKVAVFDADGTLWRGDVGEAFIQHQIKHGTAPLAPKHHAWQTYFHESVHGDSAKAYGWLAQWNAGVSEEEMYRLAEEFFSASWQNHIFKPVHEFVDALHKTGFEVWVVSGSIRWIVSVGARRFGIDPSRVIGSAVEVENGVLTEKIDGVVPYRGGKTVMVDAIIKASPFFAAGNTYWDKELMSMASELALAIHSEHPGEPNYDSEQKLQQLARERNWLSQKF